MFFLQNIFHFRAVNHKKFNMLLLIELIGELPFDRQVKV